MDTTADAPLDEWLAALDGLHRMRVQPQQIRVVHRRDGRVVIDGLDNGEASWRLALTPEQARHLAGLLVRDGAAPASAPRKAG